MFIKMSAIAVIFISRYVALCKYHIYAQVYTWRNTVIMCVVIWIASILIDLPTTLGWGANGYDKKAMICLYDRLYDHSYTVFFAVTSVFIPITIVFYCYLNIFLYVRAKKKQIVMALQSGSKESTHAARAQRDEIRLARTLFIIFVVFFICWGSYAMTVVFDLYDRAPKIWHAISIEIAHATSSGINFILYGVTNSRFRIAYIQILCPNRAKRISPTGTTNSMTPADCDRNTMYGSASSSKKSYQKNEENRVSVTTT